METTYRVMFDTPEHKAGEIVRAAQVGRRDSDIAYLLRVGAIEPLETEPAADGQAASGDEGAGAPLNSDDGGHGEKASSEALNDAVDGENAALKATGEADAADLAANAVGDKAKG